MSRDVKEENVTNATATSQEARELTEYELNTVAGGLALGGSANALSMNNNAGDQGNLGGGGGGGQVYIPFVGYIAK